MTWPPVARPCALFFLFALLSLALDGLAFWTHLTDGFLIRGGLRIYSLLRR